MSSPTECQRHPDIWQSQQPEQVKLAKAGCARCPVKESCLSTTLEFESMAGTPRIGTYGGLTVVERIRLRA